MATSGKPLVQRVGFEERIERRKESRKLKVPLSGTSILRNYKRN
jgi:hypothetical protein